ncbi:unnamed protein product [Vicia faba]|uniref:Kinesin-like protein n=1 Tax=Vicia faba TaxID=3906 RepID=A0AAV0Z989_VICFA|nr:unnamed protein product [Vicia faba]
MPRSNSGVHHHQRQSSDNFILDANYQGRWFHPSAFAHEFGTRSSSLRKSEDDSVFMSGLLDLHSFDTELLPEGQYFDESEPIFPGNKLAPRSRGLTESNILRSFSADKERANNVAKIKVAVRKRPLNKKEKAKKEEDIITINSNSLTVHERKLKVDLTGYVEKHGFFFDAVLDEDVSNVEVYAETVEPIVPLIFQRTKATCFAYGQTGSGKTYTMQPLPLKASQDILRLMHHTYRSQGFQLYFSFFEIYGGKLFDLLNDRKKLCMREDGKQQVCIVGLQEYRVFEVETIKQFIEKGNASRSTGTTGANEESSRSHAIIQLVIKRSADGSESKPTRVVGKLSFIDLAGSERGADTTDNDKQTRIEGAEINKSLLALKECIRALDSDQGHIPFRGSKLTEVLRDSFVGDSRTVMISCISPSSGSCEHTLNTLRYADRERLGSIIPRAVIIFCQILSLVSVAPIQCMVLTRFQMEARLEFLEKAYSDLMASSRPDFQELQHSMEAEKAISQRRIHELEETVRGLTLASSNRNGSTSSNNQVERYFELKGVLEEGKVQAAMVAMEGKAF